MVETVVDGRVELEVLVKSRNLLNLGLLHIPASNLEVLLKTVLVVGLGDDSNTTLSGPSEEDLCGSLVVLLGETSDYLVLKEERGVLGDLHAGLNEGRGTE